MVAPSSAAEATEERRPPARSRAPASARMPAAHCPSGESGAAADGSGSKPTPKTAGMICEVLATMNAREITMTIPRAARFPRRRAAAKVASPPRPFVAVHSAN